MLKIIHQVEHQLSCQNLSGLPTESFESAIQQIPIELSNKKE